MDYGLSNRGQDRQTGYFQQTPDPYAELGELVADLKPGRQDYQERTPAMNLGLVTDDVAVAQEVYLRVRDRGPGARLEL